MVMECYGKMMMLGSGLEVDFPDFKQQFFEKAFRQGSGSLVSSESDCPRHGHNCDHASGNLALRAF